MSYSKRKTTIYKGVVVLGFLLGLLSSLSFLGMKDENGGKNRKIRDDYSSLLDKCGREEKISSEDFWTFYKETSETLPEIVKWMEEREKVKEKK